MSTEAKYRVIWADSGAGPDGSVRVQTKREALLVAGLLKQLYRQAWGCDYAYVVIDADGVEITSGRRGSTDILV